MSRIKITKTPIYLYVVTCESPNHYYVGISADVKHRFRKHRMGKGSAFTAKCGAKSVEVVGTYQTQEEAEAAEKAYTLSLRERTGGVVAGGGRCWAKWGIEEGRARGMSPVVKTAWVCIDGQWKAIATCADGSYFTLWPK